jgi:hypothetical protein
MLEKMEDISTADLEKELDRRRSMVLKMEYEQLASATDYVQKHYNIFAGLAELIGTKLPSQDDLCGAGHRISFMILENDLDKYYRGNSGKLLWEK